MDNVSYDTGLSNQYLAVSQMLGITAEAEYNLCKLLLSQCGLIENSMQDEDDPMPLTDEAFQTMLECNAKVACLLRAVGAYEGTLTRHVKQCIMLS